MRDLINFLPTLKETGFFFSPSFFGREDMSVQERMLEIAAILGRPQKGRNGQLVETLTPKNTEEANRNSLSSIYGRKGFPFHVDMAHRTVPSHYLVFACIQSNQEAAPTLLAHNKDWSLNSTEEKALQTGVFLVKNGKHSFYTNARHPNSPFLRWDPGCMHAQDMNAELVSAAFSKQPSCAPQNVINWSTGDLLVVDNWNMMHARGPISVGGGERTLLRVAIQ
ncbi:hypothetical protein D1821_06015 [Phaeobacter inhibens]|uniref:TauD/TfdA family dioxygenase n=1 Tax=Phaeobacter inhibens TaxID=221822 RepID=UPI000E46F380|nr:TauD/TfdA family dioxygenase [Phaeobacter inhibens]AXT41977.1 hypothetical protein D1821_06015 [Phaeobacter inhibens]